MALPASIAALPMYDWPEVREATDALWVSLRDAFRAAGIAAPEGLTRNRPLLALWRDPQLLLAQACGLPYVQHLRGAVRLLGTPAYDIPGCPPGTYRTVFVVRREDAVPELEALKGRRCAFNHPGSQSGDGAPRAVLAPLARGGRFFGDVLETGSHRAALVAVAGGRADVATVDAVSWELARRHEPAAAGLAVVAATPPTPGLPFISAMGMQGGAERLRDAIAQGIRVTPLDAREALMLSGFVAFEDADYEGIAVADARTRALGYGVLA
ncbi:phosphate/phosphite/phosphonate ABC transporter substrate-binding protein [Stappia stellulata]|uniref:phosphate/phosphite/phosphonate ABC transporter substrate-binding protein n=1 Tax=Stappia stellulata TaxID=71235 RepID=UPI000408D0F3|nr:PhnD/SsuA/transferrin family substrate-binding protein [Stappia stellulata]